MTGADVVKAFANGHQINIPIMPINNFSLLLAEINKFTGLVPKKKGKRK
ncbi:MULTISPECIES: hypothetical protein [Aeromonas]|nr:MULTISPECIES: hypothetical protein [Aeromonas]MCX4117313.1 hypothetical protein [Aeromonas hydrophila]QXB31742.1 hypothetical protein I6L35_20875 [Aeromonas sp. FDAARGOS 1405]